MPTMVGRAYAAGIRAAFGGGVTGGRDLDSDTFKVTLHTSTYVPNYDTDAFQSALTNELTTAGGYTAGGATLAGVSLTAVAANSFTAVAATSTAYVAGQVVRPATGNGYLYVCNTAGTSGGTAPTWGTTLYGTTTDGTVSWTCIGRGAVVFTFTAPTWATFTAGPFRTAVVADTTPGTAATNPLICALAFGADQTGAGGNFTITPDPSGVLVMPY